MWFPGDMFLFCYYDDYGVLLDGNDDMVLD